jgi:hypothetical protein
VYEAVRKIHLYTAFALLAFVVMYFATGYVLIHNEWFPRSEPEVTTSEEPLSAAPGASPEEMSAVLQKRLNLPGKRVPARRNGDGSWKFEYVRPGAACEAVVVPAGDRVRVKRTRFGTSQTLIGFHRLHGYGGGWAYDLWMVMFDLASFSMILFAASGIYLWFKLTKRRTLGWLCLASGGALTVGTIVYLVHGP